MASIASPMRDLCGMSNAKKSNHRYYSRDEMKSNRISDDDCVDGLTEMSLNGTTHTREKKIVKLPEKKKNLTCGKSPQGRKVIYYRPTE